MTLHAFDLVTNESLKWVAVPLEFVDWMASNFGGVFIEHLRKVDPYDSVLIPQEATADAIKEIVQVRNTLKADPTIDVPSKVDLYGMYGMPGCLETARNMIEFFEFTSNNACKIVSIGD